MAKTLVVRDFIENNDDIEIRLDAKESRDECDPLINTFWQGRLKEIPEMYRDFEVITEGWSIGAEINALSVYAPDYMGIRLEDFDHAIVFGTKRNEDVGETLFRGTMQECHDFAANLKQDDFCDLHVCRENGQILIRIISPYTPSFRKAGRR